MLIFSVSLATSSDYKLLENLNQIATEKYSQMSKTTNDLINNMEDISEKCMYSLYLGRVGGVINGQVIWNANPVTKVQFQALTIKTFDVDLRKVNRIS